MFEGFHVWTFLLGLPLGLLITAIILFFNWKRGKKERRFDERYAQMHQYARSLSWGVTTVTILLMWMIVIIVEGPGLAFFIITGVWVIHMTSYIIGAAIASKRY